MVATLSTLNARTADTLVKPVGFLDASGNGVGPYYPTHVEMDATGAPITAANPQHVADAANAAFQGAVPMVAGVAQTAQRSVGVDCTVAGRLTFTFADGSTLSAPVGVGWQTFPFACTKYVVPGNGGATASVYNLK